MEVDFHRIFLKQLERLPARVRVKFEQRLSLFLIDEFHPLLNNHPLTGEYAGKRSINVTGDYRAVYLHLTAHSVLFFAIGTHSQLYG